MFLKRKKRMDTLEERVKELERRMDEKSEAASAEDALTVPRLLDEWLNGKRGERS